MCGEGGQKRKICWIHRRFEWGQQGKLSRVFCCRARDKTGVLVLGKEIEKRGSAGSLPRFLAGVACGWTCCVWGLG